MPGLQRQQGHLCRSHPRHLKRSRSTQGVAREDQLWGEKDAFSRNDFAKRTSFLIA